MRSLINRRSLTLFLMLCAILIGLTAFFDGYTGRRISLLTPFLIIPVAGLTAILFEISLQRRAR